MLAKHPKLLNPENTLFKSSSKTLPKINLLSVEMPKEVHSSFDISQDLKKANDLIDTFGFLNLSPSPCLSPMTSTSKFRTSKICFSDIMGEKNCRKILSSKQLIPIKTKLKKRIFVDNLREKRSLFRPTTPNVMDQNTQLRLKLNDKSDIVRRPARRSTGMASLSPSPQSRRQRMVTLILY